MREKHFGYLFFGIKRETVFLIIFIPLRHELKNRNIMDNIFNYQLIADKFSIPDNIVKKIVKIIVTIIVLSSYKTKSSKKCHWGDYRIPDCGDLDKGAGEFSVSEKYIKNGWENYKLAWKTYPETPEALKAQEKEKEKWWK